MDNAGNDQLPTSQWGRVEADGHVYLTTSDGERPLGQYAAGGPEEALAYFTRKYGDLAAQVALAEQRLSSGAPAQDIIAGVAKFRSALESPQGLGDYAALARRVDSMESAAADKALHERAEREEALQGAIARRGELVAEIEAVAAQDPEKTQWKASTARMQELFQRWKDEQRTQPRIPKPQEDKLWVRVKAARSTFDKHRKSFYQKLDQDHAAAKAKKQQLVEQARKLAQSTDWEHGARGLRQLMDQWKASPRAGRRDEDALWQKFRAANDSFFSAREAALVVQERELAVNVPAKEGLLAKAQALLPVTDVKAARAALTRLQDAWAEAGQVPRADMARLEKAFSAVESAVKEAEQDHWRNNDPEAQARKSSMLEQLNASVTKLEKEIARLGAAGRDTSSAEADLEARRAWLRQIGG